MRLDEAREWLRGERSEANFYRSTAAEPHEREAALARADAAMTEQAYWIVRAHVEGLLDVAGDDGEDGERAREADIGANLPAGFVDRLDTEGGT